jgi:tRNA (adenine37-N6)-methyltransferase
MSEDAVRLTALGRMRTPFPDKYGVPRQPALVPAAEGRLTLPAHLAGAADGLEGCSHVWLLWGFHHVPEDRTRNKVRPPRLGGNTRIGVLATRSPFRPNRLGLSVCRLVGVERRGGTATVVVGGVDLVDGTPVYDIKPYLAYVDAIPEATVDWVPGPPPRVPVRWAPGLRASTAPSLVPLIEQVLAQDPRPSTHKARHRADGRDADRAYATRLARVDVRWRLVDGAVLIEGVDPDDG